MNHHLIVLGAAGVIAMLSGYGAQAQVPYTNSVLNGCYSHINTSVDSGEAAENTDVIGTLCFDGNGNIVGSSGSAGLSGRVSNTNGVIQSKSDEKGSYSVTNLPGDGMGTMVTPCETRAFSINQINERHVAEGFQFILIKRNGNCRGPHVIGGEAVYQGPLSN